MIASGYQRTTSTTLEMNVNNMMGAEFQTVQHSSTLGQRSHTTTYMNMTAVSFGSVDLQGRLVCSNVHHVGPCVLVIMASLLTADTSIPWDLSVTSQSMWNVIITFHVPAVTVARSGRAVMRVQDVYALQSAK